MNRFENGIYSFQKAINALNQLSNNKDAIADNDTEYIMRDVVFFFHHAIETLFKDILHDKCPVLDANDIQQEIDRQYSKLIGKQNEAENEVEKPNYTSTFLESIRRMTVICRLPMDTYVYGKFNQLNKVRNACMHNELDLVYVQAEKLVLELFPYVVWILEQALVDNKRELFEQYMATIQNTHSKWRIETLLSLYRLNVDDLKGNRQTKMLLSFFNEGVPDIDNVNEAAFNEWLENQFCWTMVQMGKNNWESYRQAIEKTEGVEKVFQNFAKRFLRDNVEMDWAFDDFESISEETQLCVLLTLQELRPIIALEAWLHHKERYEKARQAIRLDEKHNLDYIHKIVEAWKQKQYFCLISEDEKNKLYELGVSKTLTSSILESDEFVTYASVIIDDELSIFDEMIGWADEIAVVDRISEFIVEDVIAVKCDDIENQEYTVYLRVSVYTECYYDHEFFQNGTVSVCVSICGMIQEDELENIGEIFVKKDVNLIGKLPDFTMARGVFNEMRKEGKC